VHGERFPSLFHPAHPHGGLRRATCYVLEFNKVERGGAEMGRDLQERECMRVRYLKRPVKMC
jgi:hypothetical protein